MRTINKIIASIVLTLISNLLYGQFTLSGEIRPRTEYRQGFKTPTNDDNEAAFFTEQRTRLNFNFVDSSYSFRISLQDIRIWGENNQIFKEEDGNTFLSEAWFKYNLSDTWGIKGGRQIISYDNQRFLGGLEWAQQGRRHDALVVQNEDATKNYKFHIGLAFNADDDVPEPQYIQSTEASYYTVNNYKSLQYLWYHNESPAIGFSLLALNAAYQITPDQVTSRQTFGFYGKTKKGKLLVGGDLYYQSGKTGDSKVNALLAGINATIKTSTTPITFGVEYISGKDDDDTSTDIKHFRPDFGTNHAFNGLMDYYFVGPANGTAGVTDLYLKTKFAFNKSSLGIHGHHFLTGSTQLDTSGGELDKSMGTEFDFVFTSKIKKNIIFHLGYSFLLASDTMEALRGNDGDFNNWAWMMFTVKPQFFTTRK